MAFDFVAFVSSFDNIEVGDRLTLDAVELVVHGIENGVLTEVGIDIDPARHKRESFLSRFRKKRTNEKK